MEKVVCTVMLSRDMNEDPNLHVPQCRKENTKQKGGVHVAFFFVCFLPNSLQLFEPSGLISHIKYFVTIQAGGKTTQTVPLLGCMLLLFLKGVKVLYEIQHNNLSNFCM